jgi:crotonobetaine/carnitine-CoA ligase
VPETPGRDAGRRGGAPGAGISVGLPSEALAPHAVRRWAGSTPQSVAVAHVGGSTITYGQLDLACRQWAAALRHLGIGERCVVATMLPNGPAAFEVWLGLGWLRAIEAALNPALKGRFLAAALGGSGATVLVTTSGCLDLVADVVADLPELRRVVIVPGSGGEGVDGRRVLEEAGIEIIEGGEALGRSGVADDLDGPSYRDVATLLFTSGTTGPSKGVLVTWASVYQTWSWVPADALTQGEGLYCPFPMFHTSGKSALNSTLVRGARFVWRDRFSADDLWADIRRTDCVAACLVGPMLAYVHRQPAQPSDSDNPLRSIMCGPMIPEVEEFERRFGVRIATCYSMTEIGTPLATDWDHGPPGTCGRPRHDYPWTEVRVVNEIDEPLPPGLVGELAVRSEEPWALTAGYHGLPEQTATAWQNGWFHSGDAFRYDKDGWYYLVDRMRDTIRRRGENISSFEIEQVVRDHPGVADCAAVGTPAVHGEEEVLVVVEVMEGERVDPAGLRHWLEPRMPRFMLPRFVRVVDALPRNETSLRVQKFRLRAEGVTPGTWEYPQVRVPALPDAERPAPERKRPGARPAS